MTSNRLFKQYAEDWTPHDYQKKGAKFLIEHACAALFLDPGLGKTSITLAAIKILMRKKLTKKVLIVAPLRVCHNVWPEELKKWTDFNHLKLEVLWGPKKDEALEREADIYVINPEGLDWLLQAKKTKRITRSGKEKMDIVVDVRRFKKLGFDLLVIDELTKFKNHDSGRFRSLKLVHHTFGRRWGLTGSPAANGLMGLFGQCYILDEGRTFGPYITHFKRTYFEPVDKQKFVWVPQYGAAEKIYERLKPLALRMSAEDYLAMPKLIPNKIMVDLPDECREFYDRLEDDLIFKLDDKTVSAANRGVARNKCRQVANGAVYPDPEITEMGLKVTRGSKREVVNIHDAKLDALEDLVEELQGSPLIVAYEFNHDLERMLKRFGKDTPYIGAGVSPKRGKEIEDAWNAGEIPLLFGHPQSMGHGLNMQGYGFHVAWFALTWDYELYDQFIRRIFRQGNKNARVFIHYLLMRNTIDEDVFAVIKGKAKGQQALFDALAVRKNLREKVRPGARS